MRTRRSLLTALLLIFSLPLAGCGGDDMEATRTPTGMPNQPPTAQASATPLPRAQLITAENAGGLSELQRYGQGNVRCQAFSPDGKLLAVGGPYGVDLYDSASLEKVRRLDSTSVFDLTFSPDGERLAVGLTDSVLLWNVAAGELERTLGNAHHMQAVAFSPDGRQLAAGTNDGRVLLWDPADGRELRTLQHEAGVSGVAFSPDGGMLAGVSNALRGNSAWIWSTEDGQLVRILKGPQVTGFQRRMGGSEAFIPRVGTAFSPDGQWLAVGSYVNDALLVYRVSDWSLVQTLPGMDAFFSANGGRLATTDAGSTSLAGDETVQVYLTADWSLAQSIPGYGLGFTADWERLAVLADGPVFGDTIELISLHSGERTGSLEGHYGPVSAVAVSDDGNWLAAGYQNGKIRLWDNSNASLAGTYAWQSSAVVSLAFSPDGGRLASGSEDDQVVVWDLAAQTAHTLEGEYRVAAFSPDGEWLAAGSGQGDLAVWRTADWSLLRSMQGGNGNDLFVQGCAFSPDGELVLLTAELGEAAVWNTADGSRVFSTWAREAAFAPDGKLWMAGGYSEARLWNPQGWNQERTIVLAAYMEDLAFSFNGDLLAMAGGNKIILQSLTDGVELLRLTGINPNRYMLAFSADGTRLAAGSVDGTVSLWGIP